MDDQNGNWPNWIKNIAKSIFKKTSSTSSDSNENTSNSFANYVKKSHITTAIGMLNLGVLIGKIGFSTTVTKENKEPGLFHSYSDIGNDSNKYGAGINICGWLGASVGVSDEINAFIDVQVTPWVHGELSLGLDGIGLTLGFDADDTAFDFEVNGGWGLIAILYSPQILMSGGQQSLSPAN